MTKNNLLKQNLLNVKIKKIDIGEEDIGLIFENDMVLVIYSTYNIHGSNKEDYSDLVGLKITKYTENKDMYLLSIGEAMSLKISKKEEDWKYEILQLNINNELIIVENGN